MTAIICSQDTIASAALVQCQQLGYRVPEDVSIVGFDDLPIAAYTSPPLTTIRQDRTELGKWIFCIVQPSQSCFHQHIPFACAAD